MKFPLSTIPLVLLAIIATGCSTESMESVEQTIRPVKLMTVGDLNGSAIRNFPAKVQATKQAQLAFRIQGQMIEQPLFEGQHVKKGDVLARLDSRDARNTLLRSEADYDLAKADFDRIGTLLNQKLISQAEFDLAKAKLKSAKANLANAKDQLSYTELKAPYNGTIAKIAIENFQMVQANQTVLTIQKDSAIDVVIQVPETLITSFTQFDPNASVQPQVSFAGNKQHTFAMRLKEHATQVTPGTQTYEVVFTLPKPKLVAVLPGMSAEVSLPVLTAPQDKDITVVPNSAVIKRDQDGKMVVWVYQEQSGTVTQQVVSVGNITTDGVEIVNGLKQGEQVVVAGIQYLSQDQAVKPLRWQRGV
ncbi:efflux RND transporter periplasmic adaptor subunit [Shewanella sp. WXL01]|uniref:Efflux RND transporter periplasmic adaptor subunit n=1 Tax=Shewanella maritima TaxID=2520507 RepID=A0A411PGV9_9GAMM|nr:MULTISPECIES: efflux RND transporter periplasmic adaptor subunit [Shewanella]NKF49072.1 efflux RND transporter periplasmic adaptor subunit [Shewanella sp. WXL01]QBF82785.1 efflux RND transporter periplasmic adaptor subunit [Shewanella maritima]